jgi:hypothetical protein
MGEFGPRAKAWERQYRDWADLTSLEQSFAQLTPAVGLAASRRVGELPEAGVGGLKKQVGVADQVATEGALAA